MLPPPSANYPPPPYLIPSPQPLPSLPSSLPTQPPILPPVAHNFFPTPQQFLPPYPCPLPQPFFWPVQFGQFIPLQTQTSLLLNPKPSQHLPKPTPKPSSAKPGVPKAKHSFSFCIDSKSFLLAFDGGRMDAYAITENRGRYHGSIRVGRSGLDWIIACLVELCHWDFSKKHFFKRFHEQYKLLEFSSRSNKSGLFVEISKYHNRARRGCLCVPEGRNKGGWAFFEMKLREFFLGKSASRLGKEAVAGGGGLEKSTGNSRNQIWKNLNGDMKSGRELCLENRFPNIPRKLNQKESFRGFDFLQNSNKLPINSCPLRGLVARWTQAHFFFFF